MKKKIAKGQLALLKQGRGNGMIYSIHNDVSFIISFIIKRKIRDMMHKRYKIVQNITIFKESDFL